MMSPSLSPVPACDVYSPDGLNYIKLYCFGLGLVRVSIRVRVRVVESTVVESSDFLH